MKKDNRSLLSLQLDVRDTGMLRGAQRLVMDALVLRANSKNKWSCWPSYRLLAADTALDPTTVKLAVRVLADINFIHRKVRPHRSNVFSIDCHQIEFFAESMRQKHRDAALENEGFDSEETQLEEGWIA